MNLFFYLLQFSAHFRSLSCFMSKQPLAPMDWKRQAPARFGHFRWVRVSVWGFLLVFYSNRSPKTHRF